MLDSPWIDGLIHDSCDYSILRRNISLDKHLRVTPLVRDLTDIIIEYAQPAPDMLHRIAAYATPMCISDPMFFGTRQYVSEIHIEYKCPTGHQCEHCYVYGAHLCLCWEMLNYDDGEVAMRLATDAIDWDAVFLILYTGDVRSLISTLVTDEYLDSTSADELSDEQHDVLRGVRTEIAMKAVQAFIDSLIW